MNLDKYLMKECISIEDSCKDKREVLRKVASLAKKSPVLEGISEETLYEALVAREKVGSTGFEDGIAIPHCRLPEANGFVAGMLVVPDGVEFGAMDGEPSTLIFFVIGPDDRNAYVRLLSRISRLVGVAETRERIFATDSPEEMYGLLVGTASKPVLVNETIRQCTFQIFIQNDDVFDDVLQAVSSVTDGVDVIETRGAGYYLHNLPIFSTFWTHEENRTHRVVLGTVRRDLANELARSVNVAAHGLDDQPGVLLAVQDCLFCQGSLEA